MHKTHGRELKFFHTADLDSKNFHAVDLDSTLLDSHQKHF